MVDPQQIWSSSQLPSMPAAAVRLLELSKNGRAEIDEVARIIMTDPALTARLLKATNSSLFGFRSQVTSIDRAVPLLGTSVAISLALGFSLIDDSMTSGPLADQYKTYWMQCIVQATAAEELGKITNASCGGECFQTGLLLDIGQLAMLATIGADYLPALTKAADEQTDLCKIETELLGFDHAMIGAKLAENWELPESLQRAIQTHRAPVAELVDGNCDELARISAVAAWVGDYFCRPVKGAALGEMRLLTRELFQFSEDDLEKFLENVRVQVEQNGQMFNMSMDHLPSASELMADANGQLSNLAMIAQMESAMAAQRQVEAEREKQELHVQNEQLREEAFHDALTKVYNRKFFDETIRQHAELCGRTGQQLGVIFIDVDHFKHFNDTYGHQVGDFVLQHVARLLQKNSRGCDTLARYGGEEFVILIDNPDSEGLTVLAERIRAAIEETEATHEGESYAVTVSVGAAAGTPNSTTEEIIEKLVTQADQAMYDSKKAGRNQVHIRWLDDSKSAAPRPASIAGQPSTCRASG